MDVPTAPVEVAQLRIVAEDEWAAMVDRVRELESLTRFAEEKPKAGQPQIKVTVEETFTGSREELIKELTKELISNSII